jgi:hypothetical protein
LPEMNENEEYTVKGQYNDQFASIKSIDELTLYIQQLANHEGISIEDTMFYLEKADTIMSRRFYHGTNRYSFTESWLIYTLGKLWPALQAIVIAEDLMKDNVTMCSQQQIVFQEVLKRLGYPYRSVFFKNHQGTEVYFNNSWHFYDSDYEVDLHGRPSAEELLSDRNRFESIYKASRGADFNQNFDNLLSTDKVSYGEVNGDLGQKMRWLHKFLKILPLFAASVFLTIFLAITFSKN